jgi:hypothetical protein
MKKSLIFEILIFVLVVVFTIFVFMLYGKDTNKPDTSPISEGAVLVNNIQRTAKLTVIENNFTEVLTYSNYDYWDIPGFRKTMIVKVDARVGIGLNLKELDIEIDKDTKRIILNKIPESEILYIQDNIDYYSSETGLFSSFVHDDYTKIHEDTKQRILESVNKSNLFEEVKTEFTNHLKVVGDLANMVGWKLVVNDPTWEPEIKNERN